ncbi:GNAT family N-acetyltransferase [Aquibium oceanicum]|uniref:N-acetyltransferase domain-containing protein n=1 Tax=Aquibium oceanicum TaxID=1670800 RepID=A0A1L3SSZ4_9HYPH|nr:GNAT family N-acetyltransferase [Aquibium oceanicum]APH72529.1 hypothetical protein BSQ44_15060 [Aquibium oceanicum]
MAVSEAGTIERLTTADIASGMALSTEAGWNQTEADWRHFIVEGHAIGMRAPDGRLVASAAALPYDGPFGFVGMVLVTADWRRRGIATRLVDQCVAELRGRGLVPVLDATAAGAEVYRRQGFVGQFGFDRWEGKLEPSAPGDGRLGSLSGDPVELDAEAFGARRGKLLADFLSRPGTSARGNSGRFALLRNGRRALQAGPVVAAGEDAAIDLLGDLFAGTRGPVFIDVLAGRSRVGDWLAARGFTIQRSFTRMALGREAPFGRPERLFAVAGPEFG